MSSRSNKVSCPRRDRLRRDDRRRCRRRCGRPCRSRARCSRRLPRHLGKHLGFGRALAFLAHAGRSARSRHRAAAPETAGRPGPDSLAGGDVLQAVAARHAVAVGDLALRRHAIGIGPTALQGPTILGRQGFELNASSASESPASLDRIRAARVLAHSARSCQARSRRLSRCGPGPDLAGIKRSSANADH